ncbi:hypothetical protein CVV68_05965 [Arthrobacter livingstonensis]|uniref:DUF4082 domain-containing protein n=1 Tax=Arthrobacter livingstonensis TaxID=670078 RepID=A0A2V5LAK2_9MICC|nr:DUF4082 domain-containing protein [Arthrobacter livingstonensis]PYI68358.1 hypothetical protein CVV68_05965 [Arthrobacter livingstonensis]
MQKKSAKPERQWPSHGQGRSGRTTTAIVAVAALALLVPFLVTTTSSYSPSAAASVTVLGNEVPKTLVDPDRASVELGARFSTTEDGTVTAIRFYKTRSNSGPHVANLWSPQGKILATATLPSAEETTSGWQTVVLPVPVKIDKGQKYVASYIAPRGRYSADDHGLDNAKTNGPLTIPAGGGVYAYGTGGTYPNKNYENSNYFVDVTFEPSTTSGTTAPPTSTSTPTTMPTPTATTTAVPTPTPTEPSPTPSAPPTTLPPTTAPPTGTLPSGVTVRAVDGGVGYYKKFNNPLPSTMDYFPVGVWYESVVEPSDTVKDTAAGINTYVELTEDSNVNQIRQAGMSLIPSWANPLASGTLLPDEADMWGGPGTAAWTGNWPGQGDICSPAQAQCGYTIMAQHKAEAPAGNMLLANYGKGVTFWESDSQAAKFVNDYPHVISDDNYWFTDPYICGISEGGTLVSPQRQLTKDECRRASNYGWTVEKVRSLVSPKGSKPVWGFVEVGHPFTDNSAPTNTGPQIKAAVWSSIIHGARGIIYFNHNFGGTCISQHVLRDQCGTQVLPYVTAVDAQIKSLAPVLNSPFLDGAATSTGAVDTSVRVYGGNLYVLAGSAKNTNQQVTLSIKCSNATSAAVLGENRSVSVTNGVISDVFADGNAVHIYQLNGTNTCGL